MGVVYHAPERHPFCDSPISIVVCLIVIPPLSDAAYYIPENPPHGRVRAHRLSGAALVTVRQPIFNRPSTAKSTTSQQSFYRLPTTTHTLLAQDSSHPPRQGRTSSSLPHRHQAQCPDPATATIPHCSPHCPLRTVLGANGESLQWLNNRQT